MSELERTNVMGAPSLPVLEAQADLLVIVVRVPALVELLEETRRRLEKPLVRPQLTLLNCHVTAQLYHLVASFLSGEVLRPLLVSQRHLNHFLLVESDANAWRRSVLFRLALQQEIPRAAVLEGDPMQLCLIRELKVVAVEFDEDILGKQLKCVRHEVDEDGADH